MARDAYVGSDQASTVLLTNIQGDLTELFANLDEVVAARDGEDSLLLKEQAQDTAIAALTAGSGALVSATDTTIGYLMGKLVAGTNITFAKGSAGSDETLTLSVSNPQTFVETKDTVYDITDGAAFEIDPGNGNIQTVTLGDDRTPLATNFAEGQCILLGIDDGSTYAVTWTGVDVTWVTPGGSAEAPTLGESGYTWIMLWMEGTDIYGCEVGQI